MHVIGTAGHVDHGKSTLVERLTGIDPDRFAEEKRRGLTIDLGFAWLALPSGREIGLIDVPGHERFIKNMLAGAGGISICLFVVAANEGWKPQSAEHLAIVDTLGISAGVVALTKTDLVDADTLELRTAEIEEHLEPSTLAGARVVPVSALTGAGIPGLLAEIDRLVAEAPPAQDAGDPRLWVDRVFTIAGAGTVVTGTLMGGSLSVGREVEVSPGGRRARVRGIQSHKKDVETIGPGNRVALNLAGLDRHATQRGDAVVLPRRVRPTRRVDAWLRLPPASVTTRNHEVTDRGAHLLYAGSAETPVRLHLLDKPSLGAGEEGFAQIAMRDALPLRHGDRFVLRDVGRIVTFGGGIVLDPLAEPIHKDRVERTRFLASLLSAEGPDRLHAFVARARRIDAGEARFRAGVGPDLPWAGPVLGDLLVSGEELTRMTGVADGVLERYLADHPLDAGMPRETLRAELDLEQRQFDALIALDDKLIENGTRINLRGTPAALTPEQHEAREELIARIEGNGFNPPLAKDLGAPRDLVRALADAGELVWIGGFYLSRAQAQRARDLVRAAIEAEGPITVARVRDVLQTSRKYAVPLCEWLDSTGATIRRGDERLLGPRP